MSAVKDSISPQTIAAVEAVAEYEHGFITDIEMEMAPKGLNTDIVRYISAKKNVPALLKQVDNNNNLMVAG